MRLLMVATFLSGLLVLNAHAQASASTRKGVVSTSSQVDLHKPFHMPASERKLIANFPSWVAPQKPFRIYGNTWYIGSHGLGVYLITAPAGDVLLGSGVPGSAALIEANIRALGIDLHDIKWILSAHAHFDHAGGMKQLAYDTGAQVIASAADTPLLERGGHDDPEYGDKFLFPPVHVTRTVANEESLHLGDLVLTAHMTPGHTKGNTTWAWMSCEGARCLHMLDLGSLSAPGYKLIGNPRYPNVIKDFEHGFEVVANLPCDIPLAPHPGRVHFWARVAKRSHGDANALVQSKGCRAFAKSARESFESQLKVQRADAEK